MDKYIVDTKLNIYEAYDNGYITESEKSELLNILETTDVEQMFSQIYAKKAFKYYEDTHELPYKFNELTRKKYSCDAYTHKKNKLLKDNILHQILDRISDNYSSSIKVYEYEYNSKPVINVIVNTDVTDIKTNTSSDAGSSVRKSLKVTFNDARLNKFKDYYTAKCFVNLDIIDTNAYKFITEWYRKYKDSEKK